MFDEKGRFLIKDYNRQTTFASFLPGISGVHGIPVWSFYVNRGQGISSFGTENKTHSIMEFYPAHQAYQFTGTTGFRTFLTVDGSFYEPFRDDKQCADMYIGMNELELEEINDTLGIKVNVLYYTLPGEPVGGLVRLVTVKELTGHQRKIELLDGMPSVMPYGIALMDFKEMAQTMKAWMQVEDAEEGLPYYRVRFSTKDSAKVSKIEEGNFMISMSEGGERLPVIVDPDLVFGYDTSFDMPVGFKKLGAEGLCSARQIAENKVPCGFSCRSTDLAGNGELWVASVIGKADSKRILRNFAGKLSGERYIQDKYREAEALTKSLCSVIRTKTANPVFDAYCEQTYLDNVLRGGTPIQLGKDKVFYTYSRKHGDLERDYNFFSMMPEYFSQGNGNFRDVNQNRRSDVLFAPFVGTHNIKMFYNLIQLDGYNPLLIKQVTFELKVAGELLLNVEEADRDKVAEFFLQEFTPGNLFAFLEKEAIGLAVTREEFAEEVLKQSTEKLNAEFGEGYWTDHWTYNLDLVDTFLAVYPEQEEQLLYGEPEYTYYDSRAIVRPRIQRYVRTEQGVRQYHALDEDAKRDITNTRVCTQYGSGNVYTSTLMTKLLLISVNKMAALDFYGMGVEMEGGKPGWYDALNGLPGLFGSSVAESLELIRLIRFLLAASKKYKREVMVPMELHQFLTGLNAVLRDYKQLGENRLWVWNRFNSCKERYRAATIWGIDGEEAKITAGELEEALGQWLDYLEEGIQMAKERTGGLIPTYFSYRFQDYTCQEEDILPEELQIVDMPLFLEGFVRYMRLGAGTEEKKALYDRVKTTELYDKVLGMYKVNAPLTDAPFEIGRAKAFSPGWLENESIWLHMEYKYMLELLKSGLYEEFNETFKRAAVPFLDEAVYGRSTLENSSFIASSANKDAAIHGKGFVARLSGSTAEFLQIWQIMMFGLTPFKVENGQLFCCLEPMLPEYLIPEDRSVTAAFLGQTEVVYHFGVREAVRSERREATEYSLTYVSEVTQRVQGRVLEGELAECVRSGAVKRIEVFVM